MFIRPIFLLFLSLLILIPTAHSAPLDDWNALIVEGSKQKFDGSYDGASQSFTKAVAFAEKQKLPNKCLPISLCRLAESELNANRVKEADSHFDQITNIIKSQKASGTLDSQVSFWGAALADAYLSNHKPETRELCLKHACYLKTLVYGASHRNSTDCLNKLAEYYIDTDKVDKALKILEMTDGLTTKQFGNDPNRFGNLLNDLAIKCEKEHKYNQAKQLELEVIKIAQANKNGILNSGLPAFYSLLSINALDQDKVADGKMYQQTAIKDGRRVKRLANHSSASDYLSMLPRVVWTRRDDGKYALAESEYENLTAVENIISVDDAVKYLTLTLLADVYSYRAKDKAHHHELAKAVDCIDKCIAIARTPRMKGSLENDIPDLYMRKGGFQIQAGDFDQADISFIEGLKNEKEKDGFHTTLIWFWWGNWLDNAGKQVQGAQKLDKAFKLANRLPRIKRGTLLADLLAMLAYTARSKGDYKMANRFSEQSAKEIKQQKEAHTLACPDIFHRM